MMLLSFLVFHVLTLATSVQARHTHNLDPETEENASRHAPKRVAIIGAGAAGTSASWHLAQDAKRAGIPYDITIFERNPYIGGRSTTIYPFNDSSLAPVELGASIFVEVNHILMKAVKDFDLETTEPYTKAVSSSGTNAVAAPAAPFMGIYDGSKFVVQMQDSGWWSSAKLLWRYGFAPFKAQRLMKDIVGRFLRIYNEEEGLFPFPNLTKRVYDLELRESCGVTGEQFLKQNGIADNFANDIIQAMTRVNYAANLGVIHGLETMVSIATDGAVAVKGGNWQIFNEFANRSAERIHMSTIVTGLHKHSTGRWTVKYASKDDTSAQAQEEFDTVILAAPFQYASLDVKPTMQVEPDTIPYVNLHVTFFASPHVLVPSAFNLPPNEGVPRMLLTTLQENEHPGSNPNFTTKVPFNSISLLGTRLNRKTGLEENVYKIFSMDLISSAFLQKIIGGSQETETADISWIYRKLWQSYPVEFPRVTFEELRLDENLWYTSGIESFISTMETSALMGKNVARLIVNEWASQRRSNPEPPPLDLFAPHIPIQVEL